jgi:hypothetical protein
MLCPKYIKYAARSDLEKAFQVLQGTSTVVLVGTINEYFKFLNRLCDMLITIISWDYLNLSVVIHIKKFPDSDTSDKTYINLSLFFSHGQISRNY